MENKNLPIQERQRWLMFKPIDEEKIEALKKQVSNNLGFDFSNLPVTIDGPGDWRFDFQEAQSKLYLKSKDFESYKELLKKYGLDFKNLPPNADKLIRGIATKEGVTLDDMFEGFVYNLGGRHVMYVAIREDRVMDMALKYKSKEKDETKIETTEDAKKYLRNLAEKYFYHEVGHTIFAFLINEADQDRWSEFVNADNELKQRVIEVQRDKHPSSESIPIAEEAFADLTTEVASLDKTNRLGNFPEAIVLLREILTKNGFKLLR